MTSLPRADRATLRPRLPSLHTHHIRNVSTNTVDSDSSDSSPGLDDDTEDFMFHTNDSESSIGVLTAMRECDMDVALEHVHRMSPIQKLPPELLITIFSKLTTTGDLRNCMLVCYHWALYTVNILWHRPLCSKWSNLLNIARTLADPRPTFPYHEMVKRLNLSAIADKVSDGTTQAFIACKAVERLTLTSCSKLTDLGVEGLVDGTRRLQALDVTDLDSITDRTMHRVAQNCPKLQGLNITNCSLLTDESLIAVAHSCTQLKRLKLNGVSRATDDAVIAVAQNCRSILEIDLAGCHSIGSSSVTALLSNLPQLRELRLAHCIGIDDRAFTDLPPHLKFDALRILDLTACEGVRDDAIARIIPAAPRLRNLVLAKCRFITDLAVKAICTLTKNLHYIHLGHCTHLTDSAVIELVQQCNRIRYIDLACCSRLTDLSVRHLAKLPKLRRIGLVKCQALTDDSIIALARGPWGSSSQKQGVPTQFVSLERVHLSYCVQLTLKGITQLLLNCPRLTHLSLTGVQAFLRDDLTKFCREAPSEFTHPQRDVFCVFSGEGVNRLREYLAHLALREQREQEAQALEDERLLGPDSPDADSMSDGTIDGNDQQMDFVYHPSRHGIPQMINARGRPRPRSMHDISFHVDMPFIPVDQIQRVGPWTPGAPLTPEIRAQHAPGNVNLVGGGSIQSWNDLQQPSSRSPVSATNVAPSRHVDDTAASRSQSRRHTMESSDGFFVPQTPSIFHHPELSPRPSNTMEEARWTLFRESTGHLPPLAQLGSTPLVMRQELSRSNLRPSFDVSPYDVSHEAIMATIPSSSHGSRQQSRSNSPHTTRTASAARLSSFFGNMRASSPLSAEAGSSSSRLQQGRSREASRRREADPNATYPTLASRDNSGQISATADADRGSLTRHIDSPMLPPGLMEQISMTPETLPNSPDPPHNSTLRQEFTEHSNDIPQNNNDVRMT